MAHDKDGSISEEHTSRDVPRFKSTLEDIDFAVYKFVNSELDLQTKTNKGFNKVPVIWSERTTLKMIASKETILA